MDRPESNKNKAKTWLYRILKIKNHHGERNISGDIPSVTRERTVTTSDESEPSNCTRTRSSFRRSIKKMQTTVKGCMFRQKNRSLPQPPPIPSSSRRLPEVTIAEMHTSDTYGLLFPPQRSPEAHNHRIPTDEILSLSNYYWYWGPMTTAEAEEKLKHKPDGTFLVRDSSSTSYLFSISFRTVGKTMHARIDYSRGMYNLYGYEGFPTIAELIEDARRKSENGVYCFSSRGGQDCDFPVRLTKPISRYTQVRSLKYLCRFVIRQRTNINDIPKLPLPTVLSSYLLEGPYF